MNNKGFTLIEIIVVIGILGVLGAIISVALSNMLKKTENEQCDNFIQEVEEGACAFSSLTKEINGEKVPVCDRNNSTCQITIKDLYEHGYIKDDYDACCDSNLKMDDYVVVEWDLSGEKKCTYNSTCKG